MPYVLNAIDVATKLVLGQMSIDTKTNEITAIPQLLQLLNVKNNIFTIDAIGTQKKIEEQIVSNGGHFVLQVKRNNPNLYEEIITSFKTFEKEKKLEKHDQSREIQEYINQMDHWEMIEKNRERIEYREVDSCIDSSFLSCIKEDNIEYIKTVGRSKQIRVPKEKDSQGNDITVSKEIFIKKSYIRKPKVSTGDGIKDDIQVVGLISDMTMGAKELGEYKRHTGRLKIIFIMFWMMICKPQLRLSDAIKILKGNTARWLFLEHPEIKKQLWGGHLWNPSYFVSTVSDRSLEQVTEYINNQKMK